MTLVHVSCGILSLNLLLACSSSGDPAPSDQELESTSASANGGTTGSTSGNTASASSTTTATSVGQGSVSVTAAATTSATATATGTTGNLVTSGSGGAATVGTTQASSTSAGGDGSDTSSDASTTESATASTTSSASTSSASTSTTGGVAACESGPLDAPIADCEPLPVPDTGDFYADCVARINQFRWECQCLPPLERWLEAEDCADQMAEYDAGLDEAHAGIRAGICEPSNAGQNECLNYGPSFGILDFCLQQMWDEGPGEDFQAHGHYLNMSDTSSSRVACGQYVAPNGDVTSVQNFQ